MAPWITHRSGWNSDLLQFTWQRDEHSPFGARACEYLPWKNTWWNDPEIARLNPEAKLPSLPIKVLHRTDGKGSNFIFSDFLSKVNPQFRAKIGANVSPKWP